MKNEKAIEIPGPVISHDALHTNQGMSRATLDKNNRNVPHQSPVDHELLSQPNVESE